MKTLKGHRKAKLLTDVVAKLKSRNNNLEVNATDEG